MSEKLSQEFSFSGIRNFRELGGYRSADGRRVKHNVFFRSPALCLIKSDEDVEKFKKLGIRTVYDFRSKSEREQNPDPRYEGITYHEISALYRKDGSEMDFDFRSFSEPNDEIVTEVYNLIKEGYEVMGLNNPAYKQMFKDIVEGNTPLLFHCSAGKDRTGIAAALIFLLLGVSREDLTTDYLLTNKYTAEQINAAVTGIRKYIKTESVVEMFRELNGVSKDSLDLALDTILKKYGTFECYFEKEYGITEEIRKQLMDKYLE